MVAWDTFFPQDYCNVQLRLRNMKIEVSPVNIPILEAEHIPWFVAHFHLQSQKWLANFLHLASFDTDSLASRSHF